MRHPQLERGPRGSERATPERGFASMARSTLLDGQDAEVACPVCRRACIVSAGSCPDCGFPFVCDTEATGTGGSRLRNEVWRILLGLAAIMFLLTSGVFFDMGTAEFQGRTLELVNTLAPDTASGVAIAGPQNFIWRTQLTLGLLKLRAPDFYWRIQDSVTGIEYLAPSVLTSPDGRTIRLEGIGAMAQPATGQVSVLYSTVFPDGPAEIYDRDLFSYAGVLVHELRHIELYAAGQNPGGWEEEVLCEQAAQAALRQMNAPGGVMTRYDLYLANPRASRYQHWYDWYKQWD